MAADTPKRWAEYLDSLMDDYKKRHHEWAEEKAQLLISINERPLLKRLWNDGHWDVMRMDWQEPQYTEPTLVGYYNWDVENDRRIRPRGSTVQYRI